MPRGRHIAGGFLAFEIVAHRDQILRGDRAGPRFIRTASARDRVAVAIDHAQLPPFDMGIARGDFIERALCRVAELQQIDAERAQPRIGARHGYYDAYAWRNERAPSG